MSKHKCLWAQRKTEYLGFLVDKYGIWPKPSYIKKIIDIPVPKTKKGICRFMVMVDFLHQFIPQAHNDCAILHALSRKTKREPFLMTKPEIASFNRVKKAIVEIEMIWHPKQEDGQSQHPCHRANDATAACSLSRHLQNLQQRRDSPLLLNLRVETTRSFGLRVPPNLSEP